MVLALKKKKKKKTLRSGASSLVFDVDSIVGDESVTEKLVRGIEGKKKRNRKEGKKKKKLSEKSVRENTNTHSRRDHTCVHSYNYRCNMHRKIYPQNHLWSKPYDELFASLK